MFLGPLAPLAPFLALCWRLQGTEQAVRVSPHLACAGFGVVGKAGGEDAWMDGWMVYN
jgi:hypothetical protein